MLADYLDGLEARRGQCVGNMMVIPLVNQKSMVDVGTLTDIYLEADHNYGLVELGNASSNPTIVQSGYTLITKEQAQDRTIKAKTILPAGKSKRITAFCVQSSQPGLMKKTNTESRDIRLLPWAIRRLAYQVRTSDHIGQLWDSLSQYNHAAGVTGNYLTNLFDKLKQQLSEFVAEFELIDEQRGAIILINNTIMGIEITASPAAFAAQWEVLIRDCYGTEALMHQAAFKAVDGSAIFGNPATLDELRAALNRCELAEFAFAHRIVQSVLTQMERRVQAEQEGNLKLFDLETPDYAGQAVMQDDQIVDLTLLCRKLGQKGFRFSAN